MRRVVPLLLAALLLTACVPSRPSAHDWDRAARQGLEDATSEVQTVRLLLVGLERDEVYGTTARAMAVGAEEAVSTAQESVTTLQPPPERRSRAAEVASLLGDAADLVTASREVIADGDSDRYADQVAEIDALTRELGRAVEALA